MTTSHSKIHHGGTNTLEAATEQETKGKSVQYSARVLHTGGVTRGLKAAGRRDARGPGPTSLGYGGAICSLAADAPGCRGSGNAHAKPSAS